jgi:xylulokinase
MQARLGRGNLFLGLDSSTQSVKAVVIDEQKRVVFEEIVNFDADLPRFKTSGGVRRHQDGLSVTSPTLLWVAALDLLLAKMKQRKFPFQRVAAVSGSGQQHGTVYFRHGAGDQLADLCSCCSMEEQLKDVFAVKDSPVWMDSSTGRECRALEKALGGAQAVADLTGSRAYERFSGNQIARIFRNNKKGYDGTERIALVSSFAASLLAGRYVSIDTSDGSGMNLMDLRTKKWSAKALRATAPGLEKKLGAIAPGHKVAGLISHYFVERYGWNPKCTVVTFSGDNPNSLAGLKLEQSGDVAVSMGTSDTMFAALRNPRPSAGGGHVFANPIDPRGYMAMICYKNGSLTREDVRDRAAGGDWARFSRMLGESEPGNGGMIGFYLKEPEITPPILKTGVFRFGPDGKPVKSFDAVTEVRAVVEGHFLSMRLHASKIGIRPERILATGGASSNQAILRVMGEVFGVPVYTCDVPNSAALGAAYRALHGWVSNRKGHFVPFAEALKGAGKSRKAVDVKAAPVYIDMLKRYAVLEDALT